MQNGYVIPTRDGLTKIAAQLSQASEAERDTLRATLQIGLQHDTEVTLPGGGHLVTQAYCSALPIAYSPTPAANWERFARLVLEASYEAFFCAAAINAHRTGSPKTFVTLLGGGAFGNPTAWIIDAIKRALFLFQNSGLEVSIVSYGASSPDARRLISDYKTKTGG